MHHVSGKFCILFYVFYVNFVFLNIQLSFLFIYNIYIYNINWECILIQNAYNFIKSTVEYLCNLIIELKKKKNEFQQ